MSHEEIEEAKELIAELCSNLYLQGHVSGTGGGISIRVGDAIVMAPSGVQKERMRPADMFVLDLKGQVVHVPDARPPPYRPPKLSECAPLFMSAYDMRKAGAVIHGHSMNAVLATMIHPNAREFKVTHLEMIKGIAGHGFYSDMVVPIIENTARECELTDRLREAIAQYPKSNAVLVRRHGVYVWGESWIQAKTQFECYEYLFEAAIRMHQLGIDARRAPGPIPEAFTDVNIDGEDSVYRYSGNGFSETAVSTPPPKRLRAESEPYANGIRGSERLKQNGGMLPFLDVTCIVLDIEGTVAPISFVAETLFPYAKARLRDHLTLTFSSSETQADIELLRKHAASENVEFPPTSSSPEKIVGAAVALCEEQMAGDRKTTSLKQLQGHIWRDGYASGELRCELFRDVPDALAVWRNQGIKTYIYSSGSRQAQKDLFAHTTVGDLRPYIYGFFDTTAGSKVEASSYENIALNLGVDSSKNILFVTDNVAEAEAAIKSGWRAVLIDRPGNKPLPAAASSAFSVVTSLTGLI